MGDGEERGVALGSHSSLNRRKVFRLCWHSEPFNKGLDMKIGVIVFRKTKTEVESTDQLEFVNYSATNRMVILEVS